jgi:hypothetical protein
MAVANVFAKPQPVVMDPGLRRDDICGLGLPYSKITTLQIAET